MTFTAMQINDIHLSDQAPAMRTVSYTDDILAKVAAAMELAAQREVDVVVFTGDVFHRKNAAHTTHRTIQRLRAILNGPMIPVRIVPGNHDEAYGGGLTGQPLLSVLGDYVELLVGDDPDWPICGIAWDNRMEGPDGAHFIADEIATCTAPLVFAHAPLTVSPFPFGPEERGWVQIADVAVRLRIGVRLIAHGHMHVGHTVTDSLGSGGVMFSNPGALARATIGSDDVDRVPQVAIITYHAHGTPVGDGWRGTDLGAVVVEYVPIAHRPAAEVFRLEQRAAEVARSEGISALAGRLAASSMHVVTADVIVEHLRALPAPDGIDALVWTRGIAEAVEAVELADRGGSA